MNTIIEALTYVFKEKSWEKKFGYLFIAAIVVFLISSALAVFFQIPLGIMESYLEEAGRSTSSTSSLSSLVSSISSFFTLPLTLYVFGYFINTVKNVSESKKELVEEHKDISNTFVKGIKLYLTQLLISLPLGIVSFILFMFMIGGVAYFFYNTNTPVVNTYIVLGLGFVTFFLVLFLSALNTVVKYSSFFTYLDTNSFRESLSVKRIVDIIKTSERPLIRLFFHMIALDLVLGIAGLIAFVLICVSFVTVPFVMTVGYFAKAYVLGRYYLMIKSK